MAFLLHLKYLFISKNWLKWQQNIQSESELRSEIFIDSELIFTFYNSDFYQKFL